MPAAAVDPAMAQQEGQQLLAFAAQIVGRRLAGADQIANRLMHLVRHPDAGQFAGSMQPRQRDRVPPVRLDPLTRPLRDQSRRNHHAVVAKRLDLPVQPISRRPGLEADMQPVVSLRQLLDRPLDRRRPVLDLAEEPDFPARARLPRSPPRASSWPHRKRQKLRYTLPWPALRA